MNKKKVLSLCVVSALAVSSGLVMAQQGQSLPTYSLNSVTVTAQRLEKDLLNTPASIEVVTAEDIKNSGMKTVFDALSLVVGTSNFAYGAGGADYGAMDARTSLRGFDKGTLLMVNGVPVNLNGKNSVDGLMLDNVDRIEVVKGANAVMYGSEAMGGVINVITKNPKEATSKIELAKGNEGYSRILARYDHPKVSVAYIKEKFGARDRISPDRHRMVKTDTESYEKVYYNNTQKGDKESFNVSLQFNDQWRANLVRSERNSTFGQLTTNFASAERNKKDSSYYYYNDIKDFVTVTYGDEKDLKATLFYTDRDLTGHNSDAYDFKKSENSSNYKANKIGVDIQKTWNMDNGDTVTAGLLADREHYKGTSSKNKSDIGSRYEYAVYGQYMHPFNDQFTLTLGLRNQYTHDFIANKNVLLPQIQGLYKINDKSSWYFNAGKAYKLGKLTESFKVLDRGKYALASGKHLKPEEGWSYEVGYKYITGKDLFTVALYHMDYDNMFKWIKDPAKNDILVNAGQFKNTGIEVNYEHKVSDALTLKGGFSYSDPKNRETKKIPWEQTYPKLQTVLGATYFKDQWSFGTSLNYVTKRIEASKGKANSDLINWNAVIGYNFNEYSSLTLQLNNILDRKNVITHGKYEYWDSPFNWTLSYTHKF